MKINSWTALRQQFEKNRQAEQTPKTTQDWFLLRDRWASYTDSHRRFVLKVAGVEVDSSQSLDVLPKDYIKAISQAIVDINVYSQADRSIYYRLTKVLKQVWKGDE
ncbi:MULTISPECIES: hypothetical protein [Pasteurellaceae]|uniref:Uncharacterized protein n=1 Tax=Pasteurella atlantica TaxID=2827233 RepID=A0AAW8CR49_9PAST|nr:hypothetical protein [Pasteurella atlantica]MBR0573377.1 hypothetical protein [Pasteurella atlantica]MDP8039815.1 hypothetical protein [Pasteurella atlantica]MDP8041832.1 hypothetical protein [Pasteurella atlantica]MDP8043899.1 hypothetical protein [Pasteurella atlantica]MDP8046098.1 hypothetical protein [Pasteurella atlantica]